MLRPSGFALVFPDWRRVCVAWTSVLASLVVLPLVAPVTTPASFAQSGTSDGTQASTGVAAASPSQAVDVVNEGLRQSPALRNQRLQLQKAQSQRVAASAPFDTRFTANVRGNREAETTSGTVTPLRTATYSVGLSKQLRWGVTMSPYWSAALQEAQDAPTSTLGQGAFGMEVRIPLLEGRGATPFRARQQASGRRENAARDDVARAYNEKAFAVASRYWSLVAAERRLQIQQDLRGRTQRLLEETQKLVDADERPAADLVQARADLADREARTITAQEAVLVARQNLKEEMGLDPNGSVEVDVEDPWPSRLLADSLLVPTSRPDTSVNRPLRDADASAMTTLALRCRTDLQASQERTAAQRRLVDAADQSREPRLDLTFDVGRTNLRSGSGLETLASPVGGASNDFTASVGLSTDLSFRNRADQAEHAQSVATYRQLQTTEQDLKRRIRIQVQTALRLYESAQRQLRVTNRAAGYHQSVASNEAKKYRLGIVTLFDVLLARDRRLRALQQQIAAEQALALAILELRLVTGTLLERRGESYTSTGLRLLTPPTASTESCR